MYNLKLLNCLIDVFLTKKKKKKYSSIDIKFVLYNFEIRSLIFLPLYLYLCIKKHCLSYKIAEY